MKHIYYWLGHISYKLSELFGDLYQYFMDKHGKDPDDAPELDKEWFESAHFYKDGKLIRKGKGQPPEDF
jgi:hypothetical protein